MSGCWSENKAKGEMDKFKKFLGAIGVMEALHPLVEKAKDSRYSILFDKQNPKQVTIKGRLGMSSITKGPLSINYENVIADNETMVSIQPDIFGTAGIASDIIFAIHGLKLIFYARLLTLKVLGN